MTAGKLTAGGRDFRYRQIGFTREPCEGGPPRGARESRKRTITVTDLILHHIANYRALDGPSQVFDVRG